MNMTFDQYISNPMGKKNAVYGNREMYRNLYKEKLDKILVREVGAVQYKLYIGKKDTYYVYFKIPSEPIKDFYYDTVIEFYTDKKEAKLSRSLKDYYVKFYSNDPSFVFTFAHAMISNGMFIEELKPKMAKEAVKHKAKIKNPKDEVGYVKSIYFAYLLMRQYGLFNKVKFETYAESFNVKNLSNEIMDAEEKVQRRIDAEEELNKKKKLEKAKARNNTNDSDDNKYTKSSRISKGISKVKTTSGIKSTKTTKRKSKIK